MRLEDEEEELAGNTGKKEYLEERRPASTCRGLLDGDVEEELTDGDNNSANGSSEAELHVREGEKDHVGVGLQPVEEQHGDDASVVADLQVREETRKNFVDETFGEEAIGKRVEIGCCHDASETADTKRD